MHVLKVYGHVGLTGSGLTSASPTVVVSRGERGQIYCQANLILQHIHYYKSVGPLDTTVQVRGGNGNILWLTDLLVVSVCLQAVGVVMKYHISWYVPLLGSHHLKPGKGW